MSDSNSSPTPSYDIDSEKHTETSQDELSSTKADDTAFKNVWRKMDLYVLPVAAMFFFLSYLDRANLGNARVAGLQKGLKITNKQYTTALTVTFVPYIVAELPTNLLLRAVGPNIMLPTMLTLWGIVTTLQGLVKSYEGLLAARFFLGLFEGGVFPGLVLYLSNFYPRQKLNWRVTGFFSTATLSGAFSGLLASGIIRMNGVGKLAGWRWIFILEGLFTVLFGISSYFLLPRSVSHCGFLTEKEKEYAVRTLKETGATAMREDMDNFSWKEVGRAFMLPQVQILAVVFFLYGALVYGLAYFTPSIVQGLGYSAAGAQLFSVPPFAVGFVVAMTGAFISDRYRCRGLVSMFSGVLCTIGFGMYLGSQQLHIKYGSLFFSISGAYCGAATTSTWGANNAAPNTRRATTVAIGFMMTNIGGILVTWLFGTLSAGPLYLKASVTMLIFSVLIIVGSGINVLYLWWRNGQKKKVREEGVLKRENEDAELGDKSAWYVYNL